MLQASSSEECRVKLVTGCKGCDKIKNVLYIEHREHKIELLFIFFSGYEIHF